MQPFKALLVEGTSGVGKSTLIDALIRRHTNSSEPRRIRSLVHLAQSHTYGPLAPGEDAGTLTVQENRAHLERITGMLEWFHASVQERSSPWCFVVLDTLHLTHCVRPGVVNWSDVEGIDKRLAAIDCKLLFLNASPEAIWKRGIEPRANEQFLLQYARKFGNTNEEIHRYFVEEQLTLAGNFLRSSMPKMLLDTDGLMGDAQERAYQFWVGPSRRTSEASTQVVP